MKKLLIVLLLSWLIAACSKTPDKTVVVPPGTPASNTVAVKAGVKQLVDACAGLNQYSYDLMNWHAIIASNGGNPYNYHTETWGWKKWVEVTVEVRPNARDLPQEWNARGQVLRYDIGGSPHPGIDGKNTLSQIICGTLPVSNDPQNPDTFLSVSRMKVLDQLK